MRFSVLALALVLLGGCESLTYDEHVFVDINASRNSMGVGEVATLTSTLTTENGARVKYHAWQLWDGDTEEVFLTCASCFTTNILFDRPGRYTISFVVVWWEEDGDERTDRYFLDFDVQTYRG